MSYQHHVNNAHNLLNQIDKATDFKSVDTAVEAAKVYAILALAAAIRDSK